MKIPKIPKTLTGLGVILLGGAVSLIPGVGPVASPWICKVGSAIAVAGGLAKGARVVKEKSVKPETLFKNEISVVNSLKKK